MSCQPWMIGPCPYCDGPSAEEERERDEADAFALIDAHLRDFDPDEDGEIFL